MSVKVTDLIPDDAAYDFDESTQIADVTIETHDSEDGRPRWANVFAKLTVAMSHGQPFIEATYVSHQGPASERDIAYALRVIETNDFGVH